MSLRFPPRLELVTGGAPLVPAVPRGRLLDLEDARRERDARSELDGIGFSLTSRPGAILVVLGNGEASVELWWSPDAAELVGTELVEAARRARG